jgi:hypothetical protein
MFGVHMCVNIASGLGNLGSQSRQNLFEALLHLRGKKETRILWVDAVCINQQDKSERNEQVRWMGEIYSSVQQVIIWLGKEAEGGDSGLRLFSQEPDKIRKQTD